MSRLIPIEIRKNDRVLIKVPKDEGYDQSTEWSVG